MVSYISRQVNGITFTTAKYNRVTQKVALDLGISKLPVYVKESSIIPMQSQIQTTTEKPTDTLYVHVYKGDVNNKFVYYEDDGETFDYEKGDFYKSTITYDPAKKPSLSLKQKVQAKSKFNIHKTDTAWLWR
jgi:alpha-glucosidase